MWECCIFMLPSPRRVKITFMAWCAGVDAAVPDRRERWHELPALHRPAALRPQGRQRASQELRRHFQRPPRLPLQGMPCFVDETTQLAGALTRQQNLIMNKTNQIATQDQRLALLHCYMTKLLPLGAGPESQMPSSAPEGSDGTTIRHNYAAAMPAKTRRS